MQDEDTPYIISNRPNLAQFKVTASTQPEYPFSTLFVATCTGEGAARFAVAVRMYGVRRDGYNEDRWLAIRQRVEAFLLGAMQANAQGLVVTCNVQPFMLDDAALMERIKFLLDAPIEQVRGS